tara:strand:- start:165 stop:278 length:114 start_codon:yes stop_codon:yes gene_type:complete
MRGDSFDDSVHFGCIEQSISIRIGTVKVILQPLGRFV